MMLLQNILDSALEDIFYLKIVSDERYPDEQFPVLGKVLKKYFVTLEQDAPLNQDTIMSDTVGTYATALITVHNPTKLN